MLVHICCAVDSHYFLQKLQKEYPDEKLIGFFYDPNIHPYSEYYLRLLEVRRSCDILGIDLIEGEYDVDKWLETVRGLEREPEKGARCSSCFDRRFEVSARRASQMGENSYTSTLLTSPKKSLEQLKNAGDLLANEYGIVFVAPDYRKASGTQEQNILAKESQLYRQDYCGCIYALTIQRAQQDRLADELMSPISKQIQPESIESRIEIYERRIKLENAGKKYKIIKNRFLNWRLLSGLLKIRNIVVPAHFLPYSTLKKSYTRGRIEHSIEDLHILSRDEVKFITLAHYNKLNNSDYANVLELIYNPPSFEEELTIRAMLISSPYDLSTIVVVDELATNKIEILLDAKCYEDSRESLIEV